MNSLRAFKVAQVSKPAVSPTSKSAELQTVRATRGFGNPRYSRLGSLRYIAFGFVASALLLALAFTAHAQNAPHIGYVYPAGGRQGTPFQVVVGGQYLNGTTNAYVSGDGVQARVVEYNRPMNQKQFNELRDKLRELQAKRQAARRSPSGTNVWTAADDKMIAEITGRILKNPPNRQGNPAIAETVTLKVTMAANAAPGEHEIRLATPNGLSNPLVFCVGQLPEFSKLAAKAANPDLDRFLQRLGRKPANAPAKSESRITLPAVVNGQIMPGAVDRYRFTARKDQQLVVAVSARKLIPYLADAVPGWFQATLALYDAGGKELAYDDDYRFHPDPVLHYGIPKEGEYAIEIKDAIYRGREDFVYRIVIGELPFVTGIFPLGGPAGAPTAVELRGWNLSVPFVVPSRHPRDGNIVDAPPNRVNAELRTVVWQEVSFAEPGVYQLATTNGRRVSNLTPFAVDTLPECLEQEPNNAPESAQHVTLPIIVNGRIDQPGDSDVFSFEGRAGMEIVAEVHARRLNSPLDSVLRLTDAAGRQVAFNDDTEDKGAGLETHHADSYLRITLPTNGTFCVHLGDTQRKGGAEFGCRLRISSPRPDFALRVVPSSLNVRPGASVPLTVYALRKDGFTNGIALALNDAPAGFTLSGARVPANQDRVRITLAAPPTALPDPIGLSLEGFAMIQGRAVFRRAVPAEDMMQAFAYRHLVPARELEVAVFGRGTPRPAFRILGATPVKIPVGGTARVQVGPAGRRFTDNFKLELSEPPEGISIQNVSPILEGAEIVLQSDAARAKTGLEGNLIVNAFVMRPQAAGKGPANARRPFAGTLPAIPFEIVAP